MGLVSFFSRAREAAAMEYGRARAERYGKIANMWRWVKIAVFFSAVLVIVVVARS